LRIRALTPLDIPAAAHLSAAAGWNQTANDWRNLLRLAPDTCFGLDCDGSLAATTTAICYQRRLAWIGMVITDPAHRRRGFARRLMEHTLEALAARGMEWIQLDATEMGAPLYRQFGFEAEAPVERRRGFASITLPGPAAWDDRCAKLDREAFGVDRSRLVAALAPMGGIVRLGESYAMLRPGAEAAYFGPCVCGTFEAARDLVAGCLGRHSAQPVFWDLLPENDAAVELASFAGFQPVRRLVRMIRPGKPGAAPVGRDTSQIFAIAGFEYG
jgi:GNAT superfamily N-acetyltransferase